MAEDNFIKEFLDWRRRTVDESNQRMQQGSVPAKVFNNASRQAASLVSGFARPYIDAIPDAYGLYNLGDAAVDHFITDRNATNEEGEPVPYLSRVQESRYGEEGFERLKQFEDQAVQDFARRNPNASQEDLEKWYNDFVRSDDYLKVERDILGGWVGTTEMLGDKVDDLVGAPRDIDKRPIEFGMHSLGMAFNPAAALVTRAIPDGPGSGVLKTIGELTLPGSQLNNPTLSTIEGTIGGLTSTAIAAAIENSVNTPQEQTPQTTTPIEIDEEPDDVADQISSAASPIFSHPAVMGIFAAIGSATGQVKGIRAADPPTFEEGGAGGPSRPPEQQSKTSKWATAFGENAAIRRAHREAGASVDEAAEITSENALNSQAAYGQARETAYFRGELPDGTKVTPVQQFIEAFRQLRQEGLAGEYSAFRRAETQLDTRDGLILDYNTKISDVLRKQEENYQAIEVQNKKLADAASTRERNAARERLEKLQAENTNLDAQYLSLVDDPSYKKLLSDEPETRQGLTNMSTRELREIANKGRQNPTFKRLKDVESDIYKGILKLRSPWLGAEEIDKILKKHPNYMPQRWAIHSGIDGMKGPLGRAAAVWRDKFRMDEDFYGNVYGDNPSRNKLKTRNPDNDPDAKVNMPNDPLEAMQIEVDSAIRAYQNNEFRRTQLSSIRRRYRDAGMRPPYKLLEISGNTKIPKAQLEALTKAGKLDPNKYIPVWEDGKVSLYKMDDLDFHQRLKDLPHQTVPVFRSFARVWKAGTTGILNPAFAPVSAAYDQVVANTTRARGTVMGFDYAVDQALRAMGIRQDSTVRQVARNTARAVSTPIDPISFAFQIESALRSTYLQIKEHWSNKTLRDLANEHGVIGLLGRNPATNAMLKKVAESSLKSYQKSLFYELTSSRSMSAESIAPTIQRLHDYEKTLDVVMPKTVDAIASPFKEAFNILRFLVSGIKHSAQFSYASRQQAMLLERTGGRTDTAEYRKGLDKILKDTNRLTGDFNEKPGSRATQWLDSAAPFTNVMFVSNRHLYHSFKADPAMFSTMVGSLALAKVYSEYIFSNWDENAYDDYWRNTPLWKRIMTVRLPTAETAMAWAMGQEVPFSEDAYVELQIANEFRPLIEGMAQPIRALGFYGAAQEEKVAENHGVFDSMQMAIGQTFFPMVPTGISVLTQAPYLWGGNTVKIDPGAAFTGGELIDTQASQYRDHPLNKTSEVTQGVQELVGTILGTFGRNLVGAYDAGEQVSRDDGLFAGILAGADELIEKSFVPTRDTPVSTLLGSQVVKRRYRSNPVSNKVNSMREAFTLATGSRGQSAIKDTGDPVIDSMLTNLKNIANRDPRMKAFSARYRDITQKVDTVQSNRELSNTERLTERNALYEELADLNKEQSIYMQEVESKLANIRLPQGGTYADVFRQKFGRDFSFDNFTREAREYIGR